MLITTTTLQINNFWFNLFSFNLYNHDYYLVKSLYPLSHSHYLLK